MKVSQLNQINYSQNSNNAGAYRVNFGAKNAFPAFTKANPTLWKEFVRLNLDSACNRAVLINAADFASLIEKGLSKAGVTKTNGFLGRALNPIQHIRFVRIFNKIATAADAEVSKKTGATGAMYGQSVNTLVAVWKYGEDLRRWHNAQYGIGARVKGVFAPAVIGEG